MENAIFRREVDGSLGAVRPTTVKNTTNLWHAKSGAMNFFSSMHVNRKYYLPGGCNTCPRRALVVRFSHFQYFTRTFFIVNTFRALYLIEFGRRYFIFIPRATLLSHRPSPKSPFFFLFSFSPFFFAHTTEVINRTACASGPVY